MVEEARMGHLHRLPSMGHHLEVEEDLAEVVEEVVSAQISKREIGSAQTVGTTFLPEIVRVEGVEHPRTNTLKRGSALSTSNLKPKPN